MKESKLIKIQVFITKNTSDLLKKEADKNFTSISNIARKLIETGINK